MLSDQAKKAFYVPISIYYYGFNWRRPWDAALDKGVKGTRALKTLFKDHALSARCVTGMCL